MRVNQSGTMGGTGTSTMTYTYLGDGTRIAARAGVDAGATSYAGKEEQDIAGMDLGLLDFGARYYDPFTVRWNAVDPMASSYLGSSPYVYCNNSPVNIVDHTGMNWYSYNGDYLWVDSTDDTYTDDNGNTWTNVGSSVSIDLGGGIYQNWFENVGFQSSKEFDAEEYILSHNLVGDYLSSGSDLCDIGKQELYKDYINYGRKEFLDSAPAKVTLTVLGAVFAAGLVETVMVGAELVSELEEVYRVYGEDSRLLGRYWSPNNPEAIPNYRSAAGLPNVNKGTNLAKARVRKCLLKSNGKAKPLDGNPGGGISEYLWETPRNSSILWTKTLNPPY